MRFLAAWLAVWALGVAHGGTLELTAASSTRALAIVGEPLEIGVVLRNQSDKLIADLEAEVQLPEGWQAQPTRFALPGLAPFTAQTLRFIVNATEADHSEGRITVTSPSLKAAAETSFVLVSCRPLPLEATWAELGRRAVGELPEDGTIFVATGSYIVFLPRCGDCYGPGLIYLRQGLNWRRMGTIPAMGHLIYRDLHPVTRQPVPVERWVFPTRRWITPKAPIGDTVVLKDQWQDNKGRWWTAKAYFSPTRDERVIKCTHMVWCTEAAAVLRYEGPMLCVGDGTFGTAGNVVLPGMPPLAADGAEPLLRRAAPSDAGHMAVETPVGGVVGMLWDPQQEWTREQRRPQYLVAAPNLLRRQSNSFLSLLVPTFDKLQMVEAATVTRPLELPRGRFVYLRSELFVQAGGTAGDVAQAWRDRFIPGGPGRALLPDPDVKTGQPDR